MSAIATRIREARKGRGYTTTELAVVIGVSERQVRRYESRDGAHPPPDRMDAIAAALGVHPAWLAYGVEAA